MGLGTTKCCKCFYRIGPESVWGIAIASFESKAAFRVCLKSCFG